MRFRFRLSVRFFGRQRETLLMNLHDLADMVDMAIGLFYFQMQAADAIPVVLNAPDKPRQEEDRGEEEQIKTKGRFLVRKQVVENVKEKGGDNPYPTDKKECYFPHVRHCTNFMTKLG